MTIAGCNGISFFRLFLCLAYDCTTTCRVLQRLRRVYVTDRCYSARRPYCIRRTSTCRRPSRPSSARPAHSDPVCQEIQHTCDYQRPRKRRASSLSNVSVLTPAVYVNWPRHNTAFRLLHLQKLQFAVRRVRKSLTVPWLLVTMDCTTTAFSTPIKSQWNVTVKLI